MDTNQQTYSEALEKCWEAYKSNNGYTVSEYMETDYKSGFEDGWKANPDRVGSLRERAAIAAMQGLLAHGTASCSKGFVAREAVVLADILINELKKVEA